MSKTKTIALLTAIVVLLASASAVTHGDEPPAATAAFLHAIPLKTGAIATRVYLDQAWEQKARSGLSANSGFAWDASSRQWRVARKMAGDDLKSIPHYAGFTAVAARFGLNVAEAYHQPERLDELAQFYSLFLKTYFTTFAELRKVGVPEVQQKLLGPELGADSARTLAWYAQQAPGNVTLRDCYQCNAEYLYPAGRLLRAIAALKPTERTAGMTQFVSDYVPLLAQDHLVRLHFADRMRAEMNPSDPAYKKRIMIADEIFAIATAAEVLGARAYDAKLIAMSESDAVQLKDLIRAGVDRFQFARTITKDSAGRSCASFFNGDYDNFEDHDYAGYQGEAVPTPAQKMRAQNVGWDISHFNIVPLMMWALWRNKSATGVDFPTKTDLDSMANQYAFHVFQGDYAKPLFNNFFDGTDGWYRVNYSGRSNYGVAPSRACNMFDPSHSCIGVAGIYDWSYLAAENADIARVQTAIFGLTVSTDPAVACFQQSCFRERYYHYADASFSFVDANGQIQYPPALISLLSELVMSYADAPRSR